MIKFWFKCIPLSLGVIFSLACVLFMIEFAREIHIQSQPWLFELETQGQFSLLFSILCGLVGTPLTMAGIKLIENQDI